MRQIDRAIPYHILFVLTYEGKAQAWIGYKEASSGGTLKVNRYYHTDWVPENELQFTISGQGRGSISMRTTVTCSGLSWRAGTPIWAR